nr:MAG TPA: DNA-directed RNA polymerase subunit [Caudoviricetes sp.]
MNALQKELVEKGLAKSIRQKRRKPREFKCRKCGETAMYRHDGTNVAVCSNCGNYILFDN